MRQTLLAACKPDRRPNAWGPNACGPNNRDATDDAAEPAVAGVDKIDYAVVVDAETLAPLAQLDRPAVA